jgi:type II secretory pathway predicted ATPase ExeA
MDGGFFYGGANRGATLDALIYVLTHGEGAEGIITVIGEGGSGKTMLCRMLMKRLPSQVQTVYLAQSVSTPEEFLKLITHQLKSGSVKKGEGDVGNDIGESYGFKSSPDVIAELHSLLDQKCTAGRRVVLLIDEAQELSAEILDELRALYELESARHKLLQIVLFGQDELVRAWMHMHKLKSCIAHRFDLGPLGRKAVNEYLVLRARAGEDGCPAKFTPEAARLIGLASGGLIQHLNILVDRSLQIALSGSAGNTPDINVDHVNAALEETGIRRATTWRNWLDWSSFSHRTAGASATLIIAVLGVLGWLALRAPSPEVSSGVASAAPEASTPAQASLITPVPVPIPVPAPVTTYPPGATIATNVPSPASSTAPGPGSSSGAVAGTAIGSATGAAETPTGMKPPQDNRIAAAEPIHGSTAGGPATASTYRGGKLHIAGVKLEGYRLLEQRIEATMKLMGGVDKNQYTIQLFWTDNVQPDRMERFLIRAEKQVDLSNLYVHPENNGDKAKFRVTYGIYPNRDQATAAIAELPEKYQSSFHPELVALADLR